MQNAVHFVAITNPKSYWWATQVFGQPDIIHRIWDIRATKDIADGDIVVFAKKVKQSDPSPYSYDDSANQ